MVKRVATVEIAAVGGGCEEHVCELPRGGTAADSRDQCPLSALGVAHLDEPAKPARQPRRFERTTGERPSGKRGGCIPESAATSARPW